MVTVTVSGSHLPLTVARLASSSVPALMGREMSGRDTEAQAKIPHRVSLRIGLPYQEQDHARFPMTISSDVKIYTKYIQTT